LVSAKDFALGGVYLYKEHKPIDPMKTSIRLATCLFALLLTPVFGQLVTPAPPLPSPGAPTFQTRLQTLINRANSPQDPAPVLTKFNLDFPGGTPAELVKAIQKATGKPLNVIIPTEDADIQLPPLKMNDVVAPQLFTALEVASRKTVALQNFNFPNSYSQFTTEYGFKTADGPISDTSIWYFHAEKPNLPPVISEAKVCRFYFLEPYLDRGFTVDDITTAIQTGWKMMGEKETPEISFHKETKLLIAVGEPDKLAVIDNVLNALAQSKFKPAPLIEPTTGLPLPKADSKAGQ
jgi:hypothetical protein